MVLGGAHVARYEISRAVVKPAEIINLEEQISYYPPSKFALPSRGPDVVEKTLGVYKIGSEIEFALINEMDLSKIESNQAVDRSYQLQYILSDRDGPNVIDDEDLRVSEAPAGKKVQLLVQKLVMIYLNPQGKLCSKFIECEQVIDHDQGSVNSKFTGNGPAE